jgi:hypothetical protein
VEYKSARPRNRALDSNRLLQLVEAMHGVDPDGEGEFRQTDDTDERAGVSVRPGAPPQSPRSIEGSIRFIQNQGIDLGAVSRGRPRGERVS